MRIITLIIIHCSAVRPWQQSSVEDIDRWHRARGWKNGCGYHSYRNNWSSLPKP